MSNRFHNKAHRFNHHTFKDSAIPDSGYDSIASESSPFRGNFILSGGLSAYSPTDYYSITTDNLHVDHEINTDLLYATNVFVTSTLTAQYMTVNYLDVVFYETSGFIVNGTDYTQTIPNICPAHNMLILSGVGLSSTSWASIHGDLKADDGFLTSLSSQTLTSRDIYGMLLKSNVVSSVTLTSNNGLFNNQVSAYNMLITNQLGIGVSSSNAKLDVKGAAYSDFIYKMRNKDNNIISYLTNDGDGDGILYVSNAAGIEKIRLYGNGDSYFNGGNVGIQTASPQATLHVVGSAITTTLSCQSLTATNISFTNSTIVTAVTSIGQFLTLMINGSALAISLYKY